MGILGCDIHTNSDHISIPLKGMAVLGSSNYEKKEFDYISSKVSASPIGVRLGKGNAILNYRAMSSFPLWTFEKELPIQIGLACAQDMEPITAGESVGHLTFLGYKNIHTIALKHFT